MASFAMFMDMVRSQAQVREAKVSIRLNDLRIAEQGQDDASQSKAATSPCDVRADCLPSDTDEDCELTRTYRAPTPTPPSVTAGKVTALLNHPDLTRAVEAVRSKVTDRKWWSFSSGGVTLADTASLLETRLQELREHAARQDAAHERDRAYIALLEEQHQQDVHTIHRLEDERDGEADSGIHSLTDDVEGDVRMEVLNRIIVNLQEQTQALQDELMDTKAALSEQGATIDSLERRLQRDSRLLTLKDSQISDLEKRNEPN